MRLRIRPIAVRNAEEITGDESAPRRAKTRATRCQRNGSAEPLRNRPAATDDTAQGKERQEPMTFGSFGRLLSVRTTLFHTARTPITLALTGSLALLAAAPLASAQTTQPATTQAAPTDTQPAGPQPLELMAAILSPQDDAARLPSATKLVTLGTADANKVVTTILEQANNTPAKIAVCQAISNAGLSTPEFRTPLLHLLDSNELTVQQAAYEALGAYSDPETVARRTSVRRIQKIAKLIETLRETMQRLYEVLPEAEHPPLLEGWLKSSIEEVQLAALEYIHEPLRKTGALPAENLLVQMRRMLTDSEPEARLKVVTVLRDCHQVEDAVLLRKLLETPQSDAIKEAIYNALGKLGDVASIPVCIDGLNDPADAVAAEAAGALGKLEPPAGDPIRAQVVDALTARAEAPMNNAQLRENMLDAMGVLKEPAFAPVLIKHASIDETEPAVRQAAVRALAALKDPSHASTLTAALADPNAGVRAVATEGLLSFADLLVAGGKPEEANALLDAGLTQIPNEEAELQIQVATKLIGAWLKNPSAAKAIDRTAILQPKVREAVAPLIHKYLSSLAKTDPNATLALLNSLTTKIPDGFGATWAPKFEELKATIEPPAPPASQPASAPAATQPAASKPAQ